MQASAALSTASSLESALAEIFDHLAPGFGPGTPVDLVLAFGSPSYRNLAQLPEKVREHWPEAVVLGGSAGGTLADGQEAEGGPGLSMLALRFGDTDARISVQHLGEDDLPDADGPPSDWAERIGSAADARGFLLFADPFSMDTEALIQGLDFAYPEARVAGGLLSGAHDRGGHCVFTGDRTERTGAVVCSFHGAVRFDTVVAQGCLPIGRVGTATDCRGGSLRKVDDEPALRFLEAQSAGHEGSPLFLGIANDPLALEAPAPGDFLIRHFLGADGETGTVQVGAHVGAGRRVQLHVRDGNTSRTDLRDRLATATGSPEVALMFSCLGRGAGLYGAPHVDSTTIRQRFPDTALAGFFCNGEIGPVGGTTYLHGYTASIALLGPLDPEGGE